MRDYQIRTNDLSVKPLVEQMAKEDLRTVGNEIAFLIRQEYSRRHPEAVEAKTGVQE